MTYTVFLSGSRHISRLNDLIRARLEKIMEQDLKVVVGDANGADKALQAYLAAADYRNVVVFCSGGRCRNNLGAWDQRHVDVDARLNGRDFYAEKDKTMAGEADYGFVLWDGKSAGSVGNMLELMKRGKPVVVYFAPEKSFHALKEADDLRSLIARCEVDDYRTMNDKIHVDRRLRDLHAPVQGALGL